jgi:hypothetical protein
VLAIACVVLAATHAFADRELEAQQLFDEGKVLMAEKRLAEACTKFEASHRLAASAATLMNLGACLEADGRLASAWGAFRQAQGLAVRMDPALVEPSRKRAAALESRLSSLRIVVPESSRVPGLEVKRNGVVLIDAQWGSSQYVDGGEYEIVARAPGTVAWTTKVAVATELDRKEVEIPRLSEAKAEVASVGGVGGVGGASEPVVRDSPKMTTLRKVAIGAAAGGAASLAGGVVLGLSAQGKQADSDAICPTTTCNDPEALRLNREARSTGAKATALFVASGVLVATGVTLWFVGAPSAKTGDRDRVGITPYVGDGAVGFTITGAM